MPETKRIQYGDQTIDMPAGMTLEEAKAQMARFFPELSEPKIETKKDGDITTYVFSKQAGRKGAASFPGTPDHCRTCGEIMWNADHKCAPRWLYCLADDGDDWRDVYASTPEKAAEKSAQKTWDRTYGEEILVWLRSPASDIATLYPVQVESVPRFEASGVWYWKNKQRPTRQLEAVTEESES